MPEIKSVNKYMYTNFVQKWILRQKSLHLSWFEVGE